MNIENFNKAIDFLEAGAPERAFSMNHATGFIHEIQEDLDEGFFPHITDQLAVKKDCGSVCCIAGWAYQQRTGRAGGYHVEWHEVQAEAIDFFGLPKEAKEVGMLALFDPEHAPDGCTPEQAAVALRDFRDNWNGDFNYDPWEVV